MAGKKYRAGVLAGCGLAAVAAIGQSRQASAATLYDSTGFESPGFTQGNFLTGQGNFTSQVTSDVTAGSGSATVYTYASSGFNMGNNNLQYAGVSDLSGIAPTTSAYYFPNLGSVTETGSSTPVVDIVETVGIQPGGTNNAAFGITAFDGTAAQNEVADFQINSTTGAVTEDNGTVPTGFTQNITGGVTFDNYELQLNYASGTYQLFEAGNGASTFLPIGTPQLFETAATTFSTAAIDTESLAGSGTAYGFAYNDNFSISTAAAVAVPEPATASLLIGGLALVGGRRRRRSTSR